MQSLAKECIWPSETRRGKEESFHRASGERVALPTLTLASGLWHCETGHFCFVSKWSPTFWAPGTGFTEIFSTDQGGDGFRMIHVITFTVHFISIIMMSAPPQIIRHKILDAGDPVMSPCLWYFVTAAKTKIEPTAGIPETYVIHISYKEHQWPSDHQSSYLFIVLIQVPNFFLYHLESNKIQSHCEHCNAENVSMFLIIKDDSLICFIEENDIYICVISVLFLQKHNELVTPRLLSRGQFLWVIGNTGDMIPFVIYLSM